MCVVRSSALNVSDLGQIVCEKRQTSEYLCYSKVLGGV